MEVGSGTRVAPPAGSCPWLVYYQGTSYQNQTFCCNITGPSPIKTYGKNIAALRQKEILVCSYGWSVLYDNDSEIISLCNSATFDTIPLPSLAQLSNFKGLGSCVLHSPSPSNPSDFKVFLFLRSIQSIMCCCPFRDKEWSEIRYGEELKALHPRAQDDPEYGTLFLSAAVSCGGKIYARVRDKCVVYRGIWLIEIIEEPVGLVLSRLNGPDQNNLLSTRREGCLMESCGELYSAKFFVAGSKHTEILGVDVKRLNFDSMVWERVTSIKDRAFFISGAVGERCYCLSCPASGSGRIYFSKPCDPSLYCYNIQDESVMMSLPHPNLTAPWRSFPSWIMPEVLVRPKDGYDQDNNQGGSNNTGLELDENSCRQDMENMGPSPDGEKQLSDVPLDVLEEVTKHLIAFDYLNFRSVSRIFRSIAPPVNWRRALSGSETNVDFPLLMFAENDQSLYKFVDPTLNNNYLMKIPEPLEDNVIHYSNHGWLLLSRLRNVHLFNPFTGDIIKYRNQPYERIFFASKPFGSGFLLISFAPSGDYDPNVIVSTIGPEENERTRDELQSNRNFKATHNSPVFFKDAFYYLDQNGNLGKLKLQGRHKHWQVLDKPRRPRIDSCYQNFLVECGGELLSVFIEPIGKWVVVYKLNQFRRAWETVTSLGNYTLYLSRTSSFSQLTSPGLGNRIYFPSFRGSGIVFFSLETGKWHSSGSQDSSSDLYGTRLQLNSCWIKPSWF